MNDDALKDLLLSYLRNGDEVVIGADVSKDNICIWVMKSKPVSGFKNYFKQVVSLVEKYGQLDLEGFDTKKRAKITRGKKYHLVRLYADNNGANTLIAIKEMFKVKAIVMEPTGLNYSWLFSEIAKAEGIPIKWIGHSQLANYRGTKNLPGKNDLADAVCAAAMALENWDEPNFFLKFDNYPIISEIRFNYFLLKSIVKMQSPVVNRLGQQLTREFPEAAFLDSRESKGDGVSPLLAFLGNIPRNLKRQSNYYQKLHSKSVALRYGIEISVVSKNLANYLHELQQWEKEIEFYLAHLLSNPAFKKYNEAFDKFGFGVRTRAWLICQVFPIERFKSADDFGKLDYSLAAFKQYLGFGRTEDSSGDKEGSKRSGSKVGRTALFLYIVDVVVPKNGRRPTIELPLVKKLCDYYDEKLLAFDSEKFAKHQASKGQLNLLNKFIGQMKKSAADSEAYKLATEMRSLILKGQVELPATNSVQVKEGYKRLLICNTSAYCCKLLFKELIKIDE